MTTYRRGSAAGLVVGVIVFIVLAGVAWFFLSDPFRTRVKTTYDDLTKWTPENIAKNPILYLNFCEEQAKKAIDKLKVSEISVSQNLARLQSTLEETRKKIDTGTKALDELREIYNQSATITWPVTWRGTTLNETDFRLQAKRLDREVRSAEQLHKTVESGITQLKGQITRIKEARLQAEEQLATIASKREMLKVQAITDDLTKQLVDLKGMLQSTVVTADQTSKVLSLADITEAQSQTVSDTEFESLMKKRGN